MEFLIRQDDLAGPEIAQLLQAHLDHAARHSPRESIHALDLGTGDHVLGRTGPPGLRRAEGVTRSWGDQVHAHRPGPPRQGRGRLSPHSYPQRSEGPVISACQPGDGNDGRLPRRAHLASASGSVRHSPSIAKIRIASA